MRGRKNLGNRNCVCELAKVSKFGSRVSAKDRNSTQG